jgi:hypothetical protein
MNDKIEEKQEREPFIQIILKNNVKLELGRLSLGNELLLREYFDNIKRTRRRSTSNKLYESGNVCIDTNEIVFMVLVDDLQ